MNVQTDTDITMMVDKPREVVGFVLTRDSRDARGAVDRRARGGRTTEIRYWLKTDVGAVQVVMYGERPVLFIESAYAETVQAFVQREALAVEVKVLTLKTFAQAPVAALYAQTIHDFFRLQEQLKSGGIECFESDIRLHDRYLMERFITGGVVAVGLPGAPRHRKNNHREHPHRENRNQESHNQKSHHQESHAQADQHQGNDYPLLTQARLKASDYLPKLSMLSLDIECGRQGELFSVGLVGESVAEVLMIGAPEACEHTEIRWFPDERALLIGFVERVNAIDPDILIGWNVVNFDCRVLLKRYAHHRVAFAIGRDGEAPSWRDAPGSGDQGYISIPGRVVIDGIAALKTGMYGFEQYSLEAVSRELLDRGKKVEGDVHDRFAEIIHNFTHNKPALAAYNLEDCQLVWDIFAKTKILDFLIFRSQITGLELDRQGGSVQAFTNLYLPKLHRAGYISPNLPADGGLASPGGYVMDSRPGLYRQVLVLDFKSLYPSIIRTFKIDPLGLVEGLLTSESSIPGFRGGAFHREKHFLPAIITQLWAMRDEAKAAKDWPKSQAIKILMNSFYGVLGSGGCRFYDTRLASSITLRGHEIMQQTRDWIQAEGYRVIYGDTDSTFVWLESPVSDARAWEIGEQLAAMVNENWREHIREEYQLASDLEIEFETYYQRFLMPTIRGTEKGSKKRYAGLQCFRESDDTTMVFKGLESVRSDWTPLAKQFQQRLFELVFADADPSEYVQQIVRETESGKLDAQLVYRKRIRRPLRQYVKNIPPQIRAAKEADAKNRALGRPLEYQNRGWVSYLITVRGPETLSYRESPIDYQHYVNKQLKPIADSILPFVDLDFDQLTNQQTTLF